MTAHTNPPAPYKAPIIAEEDNSDTNRDRGFKGACGTREPIEEPPIRDWFGAFSDAGDNGSVRPTSPLTDHSLDPNSGDELGEEDYINWAADNADSRSASDGDDGPGDEQTYQAEHAAEDQPDEQIRQAEHAAEDQPDEQTR